MDKAIQNLNALLRDGLITIDTYVESISTLRMQERSIPAPRTIKPVPAPRTLKPVPAPRTVKPVPTPKTIKPVPATRTIKPVPTPRTIKPVPAPRTDKKPVESQDDLDEYFKFTEDGEVIFIDDDGEQLTYIKI